MLALENADEILQILDRFTKQKSKDIPPELEDYINYVAKTGDTVYRWPAVQYLFREKLRNVIKDFHDTTASIEDLPQCPNVDQFNYDSMKTLLFERFDNFQAAPFTIQRLCELLTDPKKHYSRLDKFMRALEKNILVVSTVEPGRKQIDDNEDPLLDDNFLPEINIDMEISKSAEKPVTNGELKYNECKENIAEEVPSSSGLSQNSTETDMKKEDVDIKEVEQKVTEKPVESEKTIETVTATATPTSESTSSNTEQDNVIPSVDEKIDDKSVETIQKVETATVKEENADIPKTDSNDTVEKMDSIVNAQNDLEKKVDVAEENGNAKLKEVEEENDVDVKKMASSFEVVEKDDGVDEKPTTPKRACSNSDDEDADNDDNATKNPSAKKIRLEQSESPKEQVVEKANLEPSIEANIESDIDLGKESDILDSLSTEIDAQKENELLEDVVDAALTVEKEPIGTNMVSIDKNIATETLKPTEEIPVAAANDLLKTDEPVAIPSDLDTDLTPDEALNELVSSDILSVIPEQPAEEVKMSEESANISEPIATTDVAAAAATAADEMNVENSETNTADVENAMEAAPIKADEEQMDVDESNSVDAMDL